MTNLIRNYWRVGYLFNGAPWAGCIAATVGALTLLALVLSC